MNVRNRNPSLTLSQRLDHVTSASKIERLVSWNVDLLHRLLKQIVARRYCLVNAEPNRKADADESLYTNRTGTVLDEVKESLELPDFNYSRTAAEQAENIVLDPDVVEQLKDYVTEVANLYPDHPFHVSLFCPCLRTGLLYSFRFLSCFNTIASSEYTLEL